MEQPVASIHNGLVPVRIRPETSSDETSIEVVTAAAFLNAPYTSRTEQFVVNAFRRASALLVSPVTDLDGTLIGHVAISPVSISDSVKDWFRLGPLSVLPRHHRCDGARRRRPLHWSVPPRRHGARRVCLTEGNPP